MGSNPGQRLTANTITFNGGQLNAGGQPLNASVENRVVRDDVALFKLNSSYSLMGVGSSSANGGSTRELHVETLQRSPGATFFVRGTRFNDPGATDATFFFIGNGASFLKGAGGDAGTTTMSIIPWMTVANANTSAQSSNTFATYTAAGIRGLENSEYDGSITAGAESNVATSNLTTPAGIEATVNSLRHTSSGVSNIGLDKTLTIASGALMFNVNNGGIGAAGDFNAGTLRFGLPDEDTEGVIWTLGTNTNRIGAVIDGSGGLTKTGTGTLVLSGLNTYTGTTYVGAGTLQVGDGTFISNLGFSDAVTVANGANLWLFNGDAILDTATLTLESFGLFNGKITLAGGVEETVGALFFGNAFAEPGTYGSSTSGAMFQNDDYFGGDGLLIVVPEPFTSGLLASAFGLFLARRRRRA